VTSVADKQRRAVLQHHPRSRRASLERLRQLAGVFSLSGPLPSPKFLEDQPGSEPGTAQPRRAGHPGRHHGAGGAAASTRLPGRPGIGHGTPAPGQC
jgi:hypothetical protein